MGDSYHHSCQAFYSVKCLGTLCAPFRAGHTPLCPMQRCPYSRHASTNKSPDRHWLPATSEAFIGMLAL